MINPNLSGKILENFVTGELWKQATWNKTRVRIYHLRDHSGNEVDIILENSNGQIVGIEVKNSEGVSAKDFKPLKLLQEKMQKKFLAGIVLYAGENTIPAGDNLFAVPINALWK